MKDYIVRVFQRSKNYPDHSYPVCDIRMSGQLPVHSLVFARQHGGDFLVIMSIDEYEEEIESND